MIPTANLRRLTSRDRLAVFATLLAAIAATLPGFHALELWLPRGPAMAISHGVGLLLLAAAVRQWRVRRRAA